MVTGAFVLPSGVNRECRGSIRPNSMHFVDGGGNKRHIYVPQQRFELAIELSRDEQWDELAKFEEWSEFISTCDVLRLRD